MQAEFYPRYNLPFLHLDGTWKLDGSRRLSGYNSNNQMDFYPAAVTLPIEVQGSPQTEAAVTRMNQLDGIWKLNGIRRLDGGRQQL